MATETPDSPAPLDLSGPEFTAARERAAERAGGVLSGDYVLADGVLVPRVGRVHEADGVRVSVDPGLPRPVPWDVSARWTVLLPHEHVTAEVRITTLADHSGGGVLELRSTDGDGVRAVWERWRNRDDLSGIPAGFVWEKHDDYLYGTIAWDELTNVRTEVRRLG